MRAKRRVRVVGPETGVRIAILTESGRSSGLADSLDRVGSLDHA